jgi:hypothetical protein
MRQARVRAATRITQKHTGFPGDSRDSLINFGTPNARILPAFAGGRGKSGPFRSLAAPNARAALPPRANDQRRVIA